MELKVLLKNALKEKYNYGLKMGNCILEVQSAFSMKN